MYNYCCGGDADDFYDGDVLAPDSLDASQAHLLLCKIIFWCCWYSEATVQCELFLTAWNRNIVITYIINAVRLMVLDWCIYTYSYCNWVHMC